MTDESTTPDSCPACESDNLDGSIEGVSTICVDCGLVVDAFDLVRRPSEWESHEQKGAPTSKKENWLDYCSITNSSEEQIAISLGVLDNYASELSLSTDVRLRASELFGEVAKRSLLHGRSTEYVVGAVLYLAARELGEPRPLVIVNELAGAENENVKRLTRLFQVELNLVHPGCQPADYLPFLCENLGYEDSVRAKAEEILSSAHDAELVNGRSPTGLAGAAVYCASSREQTQRVVANAAGVSKETIRVRIAELRDEGIVDD